LSAEAKEYWIDYYNQVERLQAPNGRLASISEAASKAAENAARIACVLSTYEDSNSFEIHLPHVENACHLAQFFLDTHLYLMAPPEDYDDQLYASKLWAWIDEKYAKQGRLELKWGDITSKAPRLLRCSHDKAHTALATLVEHGYLRVIRQNASGVANAWSIRENMKNRNKTVSI
jgi:hypothetical protein